MSRLLHVMLPRWPDPRACMLWDALAVRLDVDWVMHLHPAPHVRIHDGHSALTIPVGPIDAIQLQELIHGSGRYWFLASRPLVLQQETKSFHLNADIITPLQRMAALMLEDNLYPRAVDGTIAGASYAALGIHRDMLGIDYIGDLAALIAELFQRPLRQAWEMLAPGAPYALITTFDCDGFSPGQPDALRCFLDEHEVERPTMFVMASDDSDLTLYDLRYDPADPALRPLYEISEIGLHSSYRAYHDGARMAAQKTRLEEAIGHTVHGHRSRYLRFGFPYTWGYVAKAGFAYDMTVGFCDMPGHRQGGSHPIPLADPSGGGRLLWSWGVGLMDQHLFMPGSPLAWNEPAGKAVLTDWLARLRATGGTLVLDWHVHAMDRGQFPDHFDALGWLLREARRDGAWIGGAGLLLDQYGARKSGRHLLAQVAMRTKELSAIAGDSKVRHTAHYVKGADGANLTSIEYVDAGAHSFLAALPADATRIADVGCGSGWISHRVPPMRQVLGIDIDEGITQRISRRGIVGALPNLPLEDAQADLVLCTDVLEHLTPAEVVAAGVEFDRVSTRYAYLQTPCRERLEDSELHCTACGVRWHVSHHLAAHDGSSLARVMPSGWYPHSVIYTGESRIIDSSLRNATGELLGGHPMRNESHVCYACGHVNPPQSSGPDPRLAEVQATAHRPLPYYSEVAVMAARTDVLRLWEDSQPIVESHDGTCAFLPVPHRSSSHSLDFCAPVEEVASVNSAYQIPVVVLNHATMLRCATGTELVTSGLSENATLYMLFPDQHAAGERFELRGTVLSELPAALVLQAVNWREESCGVAHATLDTGDFCFQLLLEKPAYCVALYVKHGDQVCLQHAIISGEARPLYLYDFGAFFANGHVQLHRRGVSWRWLIPSHGRLWADVPFLAQPLENLPAVPHAATAAMDALLQFDMQKLLHVGMQDDQHPFEVPLQAFDFAELQAAPAFHRALGALLKRVIPVRYYLKLRLFYIRLLQLFTNPQS